MGDGSNGELIGQLCAALGAALAEHEDVESAIAVYKEAACYVDKLEEIQDGAKQFAEMILRETGEAHVKTATGTAGWTKPRTKKLDKDAWARKLQTNEEARLAVEALSIATSRLDNAQADCMVMPEGTFYIR